MSSEEKKKTPKTPKTPKKVKKSFLSKSNGRSPSSPNSPNGDSLRSPNRSPTRSPTRSPSRELEPVDIRSDIRSDGVDFDMMLAMGMEGAPKKKVTRHLLMYWHGTGQMLEVARPETAFSKAQADLGDVVETLNRLSMKGWSCAHMCSTRNTYMFMLQRKVKICN